MKPAIACSQKGLAVPAFQNDRGRCYIGHAQHVLPSITHEACHCIVTSPPYWALRDYGLDPTVWDGAGNCDHQWGDPVTMHRGGPTGDSVMRESGRVTWEERDAVRDIECGAYCVHCGAWRGSLGLEPSRDLYVLHLVDIIAQAGRLVIPNGTIWLNLGDTTIDKQLQGIPWRVAFEIQRRLGWYLRSEIIWHKPNPMPESATDRPTRAHETIFLFSKAKRYYYDADAIKEPATFAGQARGGSTNRYEQNEAGMDSKLYDTRNKRSVWSVSPAVFKQAHFATFPIDLIRPMILAGCPEDGTVLDPFMGSGTTAECCQREGRHWVGVEANPNYLKLIKQRVAQPQLF